MYPVVHNWNKYTEKAWRYTEVQSYFSRHQIFSSPGRSCTQGRCSITPSNTLLLRSFLLLLCLFLLLPPTPHRDSICVKYWWSQDVQIRWGDPISAGHKIGSAMDLEPPSLTLNIYVWSCNVKGRERWALKLNTTTKHQINVLVSLASVFEVFWWSHGFHDWGVNEYIINGHGDLALLSAVKMPSTDSLKIHWEKWAMISSLNHHRKSVNGIRI